MFGFLPLRIYLAINKGTYNVQTIKCIKNMEILNPENLDSRSGHDHLSNNTRKISLDMIFIVFRNREHLMLPRFSKLKSQSSFEYTTVNL